MTDTTTLRNAVGALLDAAATVADSPDGSPGPPAGEWNADQILAHVAIVNDTVLVNAPVPLRDLITGLADVELPGHTRQLLALLNDQPATTQ